MAERNREMYLKRREFREKKQTSYEKPAVEKKSVPPVRRQREQEPDSQQVKENHPIPKTDKPTNSKYEKQVTKLIRQNLDVYLILFRLVVELQAKGCFAKGCSRYYQGEG